MSIMQMYMEETKNAQVETRNYLSHFNTFATMERVHKLNYGTTNCMREPPKMSPRSGTTVINKSRNETKSTLMGINSYHEKEMDEIKIKESTEDCRSAFVHT